MPRDVDQKKTRKALRKLRKAKSRADAEGIDLTDWEAEFVEGVEERLEKYGSAFADPSLGNSDDALSSAQTEILRQLDRKSRGKSSGGFKTRKPLQAKKGFRNKSSSTRNVEGEVEENIHENNGSSHTAGFPKKIELVPDAGISPKEGNGTKRSLVARPHFRVIDGGKAE